MIVERSPHLFSNHDEQHTADLAAATSQISLLLEEYATRFMPSVDRRLVLDLAAELPNDMSLSPLSESLLGPDRELVREAAPAALAEFIDNHAGWEGSFNRDTFEITFRLGALGVRRALEIIQEIAEHARSEDLEDRISDICWKELRYLDVIDPFIRLAEHELQDSGVEPVRRREILKAMQTEYLGQRFAALFH